MALLYPILLVTAGVLAWRTRSRPSGEARFAFVCSSATSAGSRFCMRAIAILGNGSLAS